MASKTLDSTALRAVASAFRLGGTYCGGAPHGNGHINDTYVVSFEQGGVTTRYILQRINENVFRDVDAVMDNIARVTAHAGRRALASGAPDAIRRALTLIPTRAGGNLHRDAAGAWRCYIFIEGAQSHDVITEPGLAREGARAFGEFQRLLTEPALAGEAGLGDDVVGLRALDEDVTAPGDPGEPRRAREGSQGRDRLRFGAGTDGRRGAEPARTRRDPRARHAQRHQAQQRDDRRPHGRRHLRHRPRHRDARLGAV
jgi:hypothetical protein